MRSIRIAMTATILAVCVSACGGSDSSGPNSSVTTADSEVSESASVAEAESSATVQQADPADDRTFIPGDRVGAIKPGVTDDDIRSIYGAENVQKSSVDLGEGGRASVTAVYKGTDDEVSVMWQDNAKTKLDSVYVVGKNWKSPEGVGIGTSFDKLVQINAKPITFYGFEWDYGGTIAKWNGGKLQYFTANSVVRTGLSDENFEKHYEESLAGDKEFSSDLPASKRMAPYQLVREIILNFADEEDYVDVE